MQKHDRTVASNRVDPVTKLLNIDTVYYFQAINFFKETIVWHVKLQSIVPTCVAKVTVPCVNVGVNTECFCLFLCCSSTISANILTFSWFYRLLDKKAFKHMYFVCLKPSELLHCWLIYGQVFDFVM